MKYKIFISVTNGLLRKIHLLHLIAFFFLLIIIYGCVSNVKVLKDVKLSVPIKSVFLSVEKKGVLTRNVPLECAIGAKVDTLKFEDLLDKRLAHSLKEQGIILLDDKDKADLTIRVRTIRSEPTCWQLFSGEGKSLPGMYGGSSSWEVEVNYLDSSNSERGVIRINHKAIYSDADTASKEIAEMIANYTREKSR